MQNKSTTSLLFKLIKFGLDTEFPALTDKEWMELQELGKRLAMTGMMFLGIEKLSLEKRPPKGIFLGIIERSLIIERMNSIHNKKVVSIFRLFEQAKLGPVIMKGQGLATLYPAPERRMPGDVDIWVDFNMSSVADFVLKRDSKAIVSKRHIQ